MTTETVQDNGNTKLELELEYPIKNADATERDNKVDFLRVANFIKADGDIFEIYDTFEDDLKETIIVSGQAYDYRYMALPFDNGSHFSATGTPQQILDQAVNQISGISNNFKFYSDVDKVLKIDDDFENLGALITAMLSMTKFEVRHGFKQFSMLKQRGKNADIVLRNDKNTENVTIKNDYSQIVNKIVPMIKIEDDKNYVGKIAVIKDDKVYTTAKPEANQMGIQFLPQKSEWVIKKQTADLKYFDIGSDSWVDSSKVTVKDKPTPNYIGSVAVVRTDDAYLQEEAGDNQKGTDLLKIWSEYKIIEQSEDAKYLKLGEKQWIAASKVYINEPVQTGVNYIGKLAILAKNTWTQSQPKPYQPGLDLLKAKDQYRIFDQVDVKKYFNLGGNQWVDSDKVTYQETADDSHTETIVERGKDYTGWVARIITKDAYSQRSAGYGQPGFRYLPINSEWLINSQTEDGAYLYIGNSEWVTSSKVKVTKKASWDNADYTKRVVTVATDDCYVQTEPGGTDTNRRLEKGSEWAVAGQYDYQKYFKIGNDRWINANSVIIRDDGYAPTADNYIGMTVEISADNAFLQRLPMPGQKGIDYLKKGSKWTISRQSPDNRYFDLGRDQWVDSTKVTLIKTSAVNSDDKLVGKIAKVTADNTWTQMAPGYGVPGIKYLPVNSEWQIFDSSTNNNFVDLGKNQWVDTKKIVISEKTTTFDSTNYVGMVATVIDDDCFTQSQPGLNQAGKNYLAKDTKWTILEQSVDSRYFKIDEDVWINSIHVSCQKPSDSSRKSKDSNYRTGDAIISDNPFKYFNYWRGKAVKFDSEEDTKDYFARTLDDQPKTTIDVKPRLEDYEYQQLSAFDRVILYNPDLNLERELRLIEIKKDILGDEVTSLQFGDILKDFLTTQAEKASIQQASIDSKIKENAENAETKKMVDADVNRLNQFRLEDTQDALVARQRDLTKKIEIETDKTQKALLEQQKKVTDYQLSVQADINRVQSDISNYLNQRNSDTITLIGSDGQPIRGLPPIKAIQSTSGMLINSVGFSWGGNILGTDKGDFKATKIFGDFLEGTTIKGGKIKGGKVTGEVYIESSGGRYFSVLSTDEGVSVSDTSGNRVAFSSTRLNLVNSYGYNVELDKNSGVRVTDKSGNFVNILGQSIQFGNWQMTHNLSVGEYDGHLHLDGGKIPFWGDIKNIMKE